MKRRYDNQHKQTGQYNSQQMSDLGLVPTIVVVGLILGAILAPLIINWVDSL